MHILIRIAALMLFYVRLLYILSAGYEVRCSATKLIAGTRLTSLLHCQVIQQCWFVFCLNLSSIFYINHAGSLQSLSFENPWVGYVENIRQTLCVQPYKLSVKDSLKSVLRLWSILAGRSSPVKQKVCTYYKEV